MGARDIYRDRASLGHLPVLKGQTLLEPPYRLQLDANTIGLWWFDEKTNGAVAPYGVTTMVADKAATPHLGTCVGSPVWGVGGPWGSDLRFVMTSQQSVSIASGCNVGTNDMTVEVVFKASAIPETAGYDNVWQHCIVGRVPINGTDQWWYLGIRGHASGAFTGKPIWYVRDTGEGANVGSGRVDDGVYHYMAATLVRATEEGTLYVDGAIVSGPTDLNCGTGAMDDLTLKFGTNSSAVDSFTGSIATVRISTVARSAGEIMANAKLMGFA